MTSLQLVMGPDMWSFIRWSAYIKLLLETESECQKVSHWIIFDMHQIQEMIIPNWIKSYILGNLLYYFLVILKTCLGMKRGESVNFDEVLIVIKSKGVLGKCCTSSAGWIFYLCFSACVILLLTLSWRRSLWYRNYSPLICRLISIW